MTRLPALFAALLAAAALPVAANAGVRLSLGPGLDIAAGAGHPHAPMLLAENERRIPLPQVIARLKAETHGEYVSANVMDQGGRTVYWIRMRLSGGRFVDYTVDAATGQTISQQGG